MAIGLYIHIDKVEEVQVESDSFTNKHCTLTIRNGYENVHIFFASVAELEEFENKIVAAVELVIAEGKCDE